ncbi:MAG: hypothetical protein JW755_06280 [Candidatus Aminicenantes bacterium]|nr:hypothetical protein [Candidatus Aminicenantes bacterium]
MRTIYFLLVMSVLFVLGCPYYSDFPLSEPSTPFPEEYLGCWKALGSADSAFVLLVAADSCQVDIREHYYHQDGAISYYEDLTYVGWLSRIDSVYFLNVKDWDTLLDKYVYYLYRLEFYETSVHAIEVNGDLMFVPESSQQLQDTLRCYLQEDFLYGDMEIYYRCD